MEAAQEAARRLMFRSLSVTARNNARLERIGHNDRGHNDAENAIGEVLRRLRPERDQ